MRRTRSCGSISRCASGCGVPLRRLSGREQLWNGNRESLRTAVWGRDSLFGYAVRHHRLARRTWPVELARYPIVRLTSVAAVEDWLASVTVPEAIPGASTLDALRDAQYDMPHALDES